MLLNVGSGGGAAAAPAAGGAAAAAGGDAPAAEEAKEEKAEEKEESDDVRSYISHEPATTDSIFWNFLLTHHVGHGFRSLRLNDDDGEKGKVCHVTCSRGLEEVLCIVGLAGVGLGRAAVPCVGGCSVAWVVARAHLAVFRSCLG